MLVLGLVAVPLLGGRLSALAELRLHLVGVAVAVLAAQVLVVNVFPGGSHDLHATLNVATYGVLAMVMAANLHVPGMAVVALGGACNAAAIAANGGVMPASADALRTAGMTPDPAGFTNSSVAEHAGFLGDIFAVPSWVPAANVFSVGDLLLIAGAWILLYRVCRRSGPAPRPLAV